MSNKIRYGFLRIFCEIVNEFLIKTTTFVEAFKAENRF